MPAVPNVTAAKNEMEEWQQLARSGERALRGKQFADAEWYLREAVQSAERAGISGDRLASVLNSLGLLRLSQGRVTEAEQVLQRAADQYHRCGDACGRAEAVTLRNLAMALTLQARWDSAEQALQQGLARIRHLPGAGPDRAELLDALGWIYLSRQQPHAAEKYFRRALEELENDGFRVQVYQSLATAYFLSGRLAEAEQACQQSLALVDAKVAPQLAAAGYLRLGRILSEQGRYELAEEPLSRALQLLSGAPGTSPSELAPVHHEIAILENRRGHYRRAEEEFLIAIRLAEAALAPGHPELVQMRANYAELLRKQKRKKEARRIEAELRALGRGRESGRATVDVGDLLDRGKR